MSLGVASNSIEGLKEEQKRLRGCLDGTYAGFTSTAFEQNDISNSQFTAFNKKATTAVSVAEAIYDFAMQRDIKYCLYGRKAMRVLSVANKMYTCLERGRAFIQLNYIKNNT